MNSDPYCGIKCPKCEERLFSKHRHDYHHCKCGYSSIDGGKDYLRFGWDNQEKPEVIEWDENIDNQSRCQTTGMEDVS